MIYKKLHSKSIPKKNLYKKSKSKFSKNIKDNYTKFLYKGTTFYIIYKSQDFFQDSTNTDLPILNKELEKWQNEIKRLEKKLKN